MKQKSNIGISIDPLLCLSPEDLANIAKNPILNAAGTVVAHDTDEPREAAEICVDILEMVQDHSITAACMGTLNALSILVANLERQAELKVAKRRQQRDLRLVAKKARGGVRL